MADARALPLPDLDSKHYFAALAHGRLELQQCSDCGHWTWPARPICSFCQSENLIWQRAKGSGSVHSWITVHNIYGPGFADLVPYTTALVRLDEQDDILIPGRFLSEGELGQGLRVRAVFEELGDDIGELNWQADEARPTV